MLPCITISNAHLSALLTRRRPRTARPSAIHPILRAIIDAAIFHFFLPMLIDISDITLAFMLSPALMPLRCLIFQFMERRICAILLLRHRTGRGPQRARRQRANQVMSRGE